MDALKSPKRVPLAALDANRRNTPISTAKHTVIEKSTGENAGLRKRMADDEENGLEMQGGTSSKKRKVDDYLSETNLEKETPYGEIPSIKVEQAEKRNEPETIEDAVNPTRDPSPVSQSESSPQTTLPQNSQDTAITEPEPDSNRTQTRLINAKEQAHALRLRLKMAMYKVHTNQTTVPLSRLEIRSSSFSNSSKSNLRSKPSVSTPPKPSMYPALRQNSDGEALIVGDGGQSSQLSFHSSMSRPMSRQPSTHYNSRSQSEQPQMPHYRKGIESISHAHPKLVPYARQKRKASLDSSSDIETEIPPRRMMPRNSEDGRNTPFASRSLERLGNMDRRYSGEKQNEVSRSFDGGYLDRVSSIDGGGEINIIRARRAQDETPGPDRNRNETNDTDELDVAAGGLLKLMSQGQPKVS